VVALFRCKSIAHAGRRAAVARGLGALLVVAGAFVVASTAFAAGGWSAPRMLARVPAYAVWAPTPSAYIRTTRSGLVVLPGGDSIVLSVDQRVGSVPEWRVLESRITASGARTSVLDDFRPSPLKYPILPTMVYDGRRTVTAAWTSYVGGRYVVRFTRWRGTHFAAPTTMRLPGANLELVDIVAIRGGAALALVARGQVWLSTVRAGHASRLRAAPASRGVSLQSIQSARTRAGRAVILYRVRGATSAVVVEADGRVGHAQRLGRGRASPYAGADGSLIVVGAGWMRVLAPSLSRWDAPVRLPEGFGVFSATAARDGTIYVAGAGSENVALAARQPGDMEWTTLIDDPQYGFGQVVPRVGGGALFVWTPSTPAGVGPLNAVNADGLTTSTTRVLGRTPPSESFWIRDRADDQYVVWYGRDKRIHEARAQGGTDRVISPRVMENYAVATNAAGEPTIIATHAAPSQHGYGFLLTRR
jgi:hypothetical protein